MSQKDDKAEQEADRQSELIDVGDIRESEVSCHVVREGAAKASDEATHDIVYDLAERTRLRIIFVIR
jgi:hypothetical protein